MKINWNAKTNKRNKHIHTVVKGKEKQIGHGKLWFIIKYCCIWLLTI